MTTPVGDVAGKISLLRRDLFQIRYPGVFDEEAVRLFGHSQALLPIISYVLNHFSRHVATLAATYNLAGRKGKRYIENVFKLAREKFGMRIVLNSAQFLAQGYAERKLMLVHQLIVACREYHSTAVRQERLGVLHQKQDGSSKKHPAIALPKKQGGKTPTVNTIHFQESEDTMTNLIPEKPRLLPQHLISSFSNQMKEAEVLEEEKGDDNDDEEDASLMDERPSSLGTRDSYSSPCLKPVIMQNTTNAEIKTSDCCPSPVPAPSWRENNDHDILQLAQDAKNTSTRLSTLENRLEETNIQLLSLETSSKAHIRVLEGRILALEQAAGGQNEWNRSHQMSHPLRNFFSAPNGPQIHFTSINHLYNKRTSWNSPPTSCFNPLYAESTPAAKGPSAEGPPPNADAAGGTFKVPARADCAEKHQNGIKTAESNCLNDTLENLLDSQDGLGNLKMEDCSDGAPEEVKQQQQNLDFFTFINNKEHHNLDSHDVLLSLRARLAEAQAVIDDARTTLQLSGLPPPL